MKRTEADELKVFQTHLKMQDGENFHLRFGPLDFYLEKISTEIRLWWMTSNDWLDSSFHYQYPFTGMQPSNLLTERRFAFRGPTPRLQVIPVLGELPFVVKPDSTFMILPGETAKIFLSTPTNIRLVNLDSCLVIDEIPVLRRVKTWFGDTPTRGQLCYFTRIHAALIEENLPFRPHRAVTHVYVENSSKKPIPIDKLKIPVNYLTLYQEERGVFVTSSLSMRIDNQGNIKNLKIIAPKGENLTVIHEPREKLPKGLLKSVTEIMR